MRRTLSRRPVVAALSVTIALAGGVSLTAPASGAATASRGLSPAQVKSLSAGAPRAVIVELRDQLPGTAARGQTTARKRAAQRAQAPFLHEIAQVGGTRVKSYSLVNAFAATVPAAEAAHLATEAGIAAVVPDLQIRQAPRGHDTEPASKSAKGSAATPPAGACPASPGTPILEPEALQLTNTAFNDAKTPQAQNIVDGTGVKVAFIADGVDPNHPDFIRANGKHVFVDYQDFSGDGLNAPTSGAEAFGDASAIAAQGLHSYDLSPYMNPAHPLPAGCTIRVLGMAPGAQLVGLKAFGAESAPTSNILQAIDYAVVNDNVDVINESFGGNPYPDNGSDPISLADDAAVAAGVTVVSSTGDAGTTNTVGSPSSDPKVIGVGATTQLRSYAQSTAYGFALSKGTWANNNISSLSSGGTTQRGATLDVVAPGDLGWALCSPKRIYEGCLSYAGQPASIQDFGGTSQSSPLTAGEAALVIAAYEHTHGGARPAPALVKQIITSTATDLGHPSYEQGAGLINSLAAVQAAESIADGNGHPARVGSSLLADPTQLSAVAAPGTMKTYAVHVTNNSPFPQTLTAVGRTLGGVVSDDSGQVVLDTTDPSTPFYIDQFGSSRFYVVKHFTVPTGVDRLDASIAAHQSVRMSPIRMILIDSLGTYEAYTIPQGTGNFGHVDVHFPVAGTWTALIAAGGAGGFNGPVSFDFATSKFEKFGSVSPSSQTVAPGATATFNVAVATPANPGDVSASLQIDNGLGQTLSLPITSRSLISTTSAGGTFRGTFTGGNGRGFPGQSVAYNFDVPSGQHDVAVDLRLTNRAQTVIGYLISPEGQVVSNQSNVTTGPGGNTFGSNVSMTHRDPVAGRWEVAYAILNPIFGSHTSNTYAGHLRYNSVDVVATGIPDGSAAAKGGSIVAKVKVTNTGSATAEFFVDPRSQSTQHVALVPINQATGIALPIPPTAAPPQWVVPTGTTSLSAQASATLPVQVDLFYSGGEPEVIGPAVGHSSTATVDAAEIGPGNWAAFAGEVGPYSPSAHPGTVNFAATAETLGFDRAVTSSTGDIWLGTVGPTATPPRPITLAPGESGVITVTFDSKDAPDAGTLFVDTFSAFTLSGDELAAIPYSIG